MDKYSQNVFHNLILIYKAIKKVIYAKENYQIITT